MQETTRRVYTGNMGPAHSFYCNRRYSRIARDIVRRWVIPILKGYYDHPCDRGKKRGALDKQLEHLHYTSEEVHILIHAISETSEVCVLDPRRDIFQYHDSMSFETVKGFSCGICGKTFTSQHYLDLHFDSKHSHELDNVKNIAAITTICPASEFCAAFGYACDTLACSDGSSVCRRENLKSCEEHYHHLATSRQKCVSIMEECFMDSKDSKISAALTHDLIYHVCYPITTPTAACSRQNDYRVLPPYPHDLFSLPPPIGPSSYVNNMNLLFLLVIASISFTMIGGYCCSDHFRRRSKSD
jgi:hypothetical protein